MVCLGCRALNWNQCMINACNMLVDLRHLTGRIEIGPSM